MANKKKSKYPCSRKGKFITSTAVKKVVNSNIIRVSKESISNAMSIAAVNNPSKAMDLPKPENVSIKVESESQEEGGGEMAHTNIDIFLPDVKKECLQYEANTPTTKTSRWSENTTMKFVTLYIQHECLWNVKSPLYKNKQIKESAYAELEKGMNISGFGDKEIKAKIKNIRSTYSQEIKKIKDSKNSAARSDAVYFPSIKWFSLLDGSLRNITSILTESESNLEDMPCTSTDTGESKPAMDSFREPPTKPPSKKKRLSQLSNMVSQLKDITEAANSTAEDEFEVFGRHVGLQLKSLPLLLAIETQEYIQLYINRVRRRHLQSEQNTIPRTVTYESESPCSNVSMNFNEDSNYSDEQPPQEHFTLTSPSVIPIHFAEHNTSTLNNMFQSGGNINTQWNTQSTSNNLILTAMNNANVDI